MLTDPSRNPVRRAEAHDEHLEPRAQERELHELVEPSRRLDDHEKRDGQRGGDRGDEGP